MQLIKNLFLLVLAISAFGRATNLHAQDDKLDASLLWKITGPGITTPSYLYGTIHIIGAEDYFLLPNVEPALDASKALVLELDMSSPLKMAAEMFALAPMKGDTTLKDLLSKEEYKLVKDYFEKSKNPQVAMMPFSMLERWKPTLIASLLYTDMIQGDTRSYETEFVAMAQKRKLSMGGLETVEDQMTVFDIISYEEQAEGLVDAVRSMSDKSEEETGIMQFQQLVEIYKSQDVDALFATTTKELEGMDQGDEALLKKRNENWIPQIIKRAKTEPTFFAVGAAHLGGSIGVIRLLRAEGYTVEPMLNNK